MPELLVLNDHAVPVGHGDRHAGIPDRYFDVYFHVVPDGFVHDVCEVPDRRLAKPGVLRLRMIAVDSIVKSSSPVK